MSCAVFETITPTRLTSEAKAQGWVILASGTDVTLLQRATCILTVCFHSYTPKALVQAVLQRGDGVALIQQRHIGDDAMNACETANAVLADMLDHYPFEIPVPDTEIAFR